MNADSTTLKEAGAEGEKNTEVRGASLSKEDIEALRRTHGELLAAIKEMPRVSWARASALGTVFHPGRFLLPGILIVLALIAGFWMGNWGFGGYSTRSSTSTILSGIQKANELVTLRGYFNTVGDKNESSWIPFRYRKFIVIFSGEVLCGCDMSRASVSMGNNRVNITIPHCEIMGVHVDLEDKEYDKNSGAPRYRLHVYDQQTGIFAAALTLEEQNEIIVEELSRIRQKAAEEWGLLARADENAKDNLTSFVKALLNDENMEVEVTFEERAVPSTAPANNGEE